MSDATHAKPISDPKTDSQIPDAEMPDQEPVCDPEEKEQDPDDEGQDQDDEGRDPDDEGRDPDNDGQVPDPDMPVTFSKNQIWFRVQNDSGYTLHAQGSFADWGDFAAPPSSIPANREGSGGHIISSRALFVGSAGFVGYKIEDGDDKIYIRMLASNPNMSAKSNYSTASVSRHEAALTQGNYNWLYYEPHDKWNNDPFKGKTLRVKNDIGQADDCTAIFHVTLT